MYEDLSSSWKAEAAAERLPPSVREFLWAQVTADDVLLVPDAVPAVPPALPKISPAELPEVPAVVAWNENRLGAVIDGTRGLWREPEGSRSNAISSTEGIGSNNWAVSGRLTKSGKPMLANDPHLGIDMPAIWLPMRFEIAGRLVEGVTLPGLPGVILGRNDRMAWAFTNLGTDIQDLYRETIVDGKAQRAGGPEPVAERVESIPVRGAAPESLHVRTTSHGPLVTKDLALCWLALDPKNLRLPSGRNMLAASPEELNRGFDGFFGPAQNVVWISRDGSIGWRASGLVPVRRAGTDGGVPYDGRDPENDWKGFVTMGEMPRLENPASGFLVTANQRLIGSSFPHPVTTSWEGPGRARRIRDLIAAAARDGRLLDRASMEAIQLDITSEPLRRLMRELVPFLPTDLAAALQSWDGRATSDSSLFLIARTVRAKLRDHVLEAWHVTGWNRGLGEDAVLDLVRADPSAFAAAALGDKRAFVKSCVDDALAELSTKYGSDRRRWKWGEANRLSVRHPLGLIPGLGKLFDPPADPQSGATQLVRTASSRFGQSMRFLVDWGDPEACTLVVPFGVSGHAGSPHRLDQYTFWRNGDPSGRLTKLERPAVGARLEFRP
jgi:penicillin amidase